jgi:tRNA(Ile)-lysidine synthetase-like protein
MSLNLVEETLNNFINYHQFKKQGFIHWAVAISGGSDSLALFAALNAWRNKNLLSGITLFPIYVEHGVPDTRDYADLRAVQYLFKEQFSYDIHVVFIDPNQWLHRVINCRRSRFFRYQGLFEFCLKKKCSILWLGHQKDDQYETLFMRFLKGSGENGFKGIQPFHYQRHIGLARPFLGLTKKTLQDYLIYKHKQPLWFEELENHHSGELRSNLRQILKKKELEDHLWVRHHKICDEMNVQLIKEKNCWKNHAVIYPTGVIQWTLSSKLELKKIQNIFPIQDQKFEKSLENLEFETFQHMAWYVSGRQNIISQSAYARIQKHLKDQRLQTYSVPKPMTLGGCSWHLYEGHLWVKRSSESLPKPMKFNDIKFPFLWDERFWIETSQSLKSISSDWILRSLYAHEIKKIYKESSAYAAQINQWIYTNIPVIQNNHAIIWAPLNGFFKNPSHLDSYKKDFFHAHFIPLWDSNKH